LDYVLLLSFDIGYKSKAKKLTKVQRYIKERKERGKSNTSKAKAATRTLFILHKKE